MSGSKISDEAAEPIPTICSDDDSRVSGELETPTFVLTVDFASGSLTNLVEFCILLLAFSEALWLLID